MSKKKKRKPSQGVPARPQPNAPLVASSKSFLEQYASVLVFIILITSFFLSLHASNYERRERITTVDESVYSRLGLQIKEGQPYNTISMYNENLKAGRKLPEYFKDPLFKHPPMFSFLISLAYSALEKKPGYSYPELYALSSKIPNLMGCALIFIVFLTGRRLYDTRVGLLAALVLALEVNFLNCAHKVWMETTLSAFFWLCLYFFHRGMGQRWYLLLAGFAFGCAMLTKYPAVLLVLICASYLLIHERKVFKSWFFYGGIFTAGVMFLPWLVNVLDIYGRDFVSLGKISSWDIRKLRGFIYIIIGLVSVVSLILAINWKRPQTWEKFQGGGKWLKTATAALIALFVVYLFFQADMREALVVSLTWFGFPQTGWEMYSFNEEPKYFYLKQILKYSPVYVFFLIGAVRAPLGSKNSQFLLIAAFWTLLFTSFYGSYQGRYILYFAPAAILLAAGTIMEVFDHILQEKSALRVTAASVAGCIVIYLLAKTFQVGLYHAINNNVAYY